MDAQLECIHNYAIEKSIYSICDNQESNVIKKLPCVFEMLELSGLTANDLLICEGINFPLSLNSIDYCIGSIGLYEKDLSICDLAGKARAECYSLLAEKVFSSFFLQWLF